MELERIQLSGYDPVLDTTLLHEETMEMIVPDACPDILRIVDTEAQVLLSSREAMDGRAEIGGTVKASVLYLPDGEEGLRRMEVNLPFVCGADHMSLTADCRLVARPRIQAAETRSINPRKVLTRVNLAVALQAYAPVTDSLCTGVSGADEEGVEQLTEPVGTYVVVCVSEKPFTFSDDLNLSGSKPEAAELLKARTSLLCGESKVIGNKLIFKGESRLQLLCRGIDNSIYSADFTLPFSQIMEVTGAGEEAACELEIVPTDVTCTLSPVDPRSVSVNLSFLAQAVVRQEQSVTLLTDLYATQRALDTERRAWTLSRMVEQNTRSQSVRELMEGGTLARTVLDAYLCIGEILQAREGEKLTFTANVGAAVLYEDEAGAPAAVSRQIPVSCQVELPEGCICACQCRVPDPVLAAPTSGGIEVRFQLDFQYMALSKSEIPGVADYRWDDSQTVDDGTAPSVVLRIVEKGERLWDIAKAYRTTRGDIMQANELEDESVPGGRLLLIPRRR